MSRRGSNVSTAAAQSDACGAWGLLRKSVAKTQVVKDVMHAKPTMAHQAPFAPGTHFVVLRKLLGPAHSHLTAAPGSTAAGRNGSASSRGSTPGSSSTTHQRAKANAASPNRAAAKKAPVQDDDDFGYDSLDDLDDDDDDDDIDDDECDLSVTHQRPKRRPAKRGPPLPSGVDVQNMPPELRSGIEGLAYDTLRLLLYPRVVLRQHRNAAAANTVTARRTNIPRAPTDVMRRQRLFHDWPSDVLQGLAASAEYRSVEPNGLICLQGEPAATAMYVLVSGSCQTYSVPKAAVPAAADAVGDGDLSVAVSSTTSPRSATPDQTASVNETTHLLALAHRKHKQPGEVVRQYAAPLCLNEFAFLAGAPCPLTAYATARADMWTVTRGAFEAALERLPADVRALVGERAHAKRLKDLGKYFPMSCAAVQLHPPFTETSLPFRAAVLAALQPCCLSKGFVFSDHGDTTYFLRRGEVGHYRQLPAAAPSGLDRRTSALNLRSAPSFHRGQSSSKFQRHGSFSHGALAAPLAKVLVQEESGVQLVNEHAVLQRQPLIAESVEALADCDGWGVSAEVMDRLLLQYPSDRQAVIAQSQKRQMRALASQMLQHRKVIFRIPVLSDLCKMADISALAMLFEARMYLPLSILCSTSEQADRIIIVTKGVVRVSARIGLGDKGRWELGEASGYSCIVPHRWTRSAVALGPVETIELPRPLLMAFLQDVGLQQQAARTVQHMMFPKSARTRHESEVARAMYARQETPEMFPIDEDTTRALGASRGMVPAPALESSMLGGLGQTILPASKKLTQQQREVIEHEVTNHFDADDDRKLAKITSFLWVKHKK
jgi:CRP-like cAMP-binding protein